MNRKLSLLLGGGLVLLGLFGMGTNFLATLFGLSVGWWDAWRVWPMIIITFGLLLIAPPLLSPRNRGLGYLFIPGTPILTIGCMLMFGSVFNAWDIWETWWPLVLLSFGFGFFLAGIFGRNVYMVIPSLIILMNGAVLQFCTLTGFWASWAVLWVVEPLSVGLALLIIGLRKRSNMVLAFAFVLCTFSGIAFFGMSALLFSNSWLFQYGASAILILTGVLVLLAGLFGKPSTSRNGGSNGKGEGLEEALA